MNEKALTAAATIAEKVQELFPKAEVTQPYQAPSDPFAIGFFVYFDTANGIFFGTKELEASDTDVLTERVRNHLVELAERLEGEAVDIRNKIQKFSLNSVQQ